VIRLASFFGLIALAMLLPLLFDLSGGSAILFAFVGMPALVLSLAIHGIARWRAGAFRLDRDTRLR
jgi:hypothetical protein